MSMLRGWKKDEFSSPDMIWDLDLNGTVLETIKGKVVERKVDGSYVKLVYLYLVRTLDMHNEVFPSYATMAKYTHLSSRTAIRCVKVLVEFGLIEKITRKKDNTDRHDSNVYIVHHPKMLTGLKFIDGYERGAQPIEDGYERGAQPGYERGAYYSTLKDSVLKDSVCKDDNFNLVSQAWKDCFQENMDKIEFINLYKKSNIEFLLSTIALIKKHHDISKIKSAFAFMSNCIDLGGYIVKAKKKRTVAPKENKKKASTLPKAVAGQTEVKKTDAEELAIKKARVEKKLAEMEARRKSNRVMSARE